MTRIVEGDTVGPRRCLALLRGLTSRDRTERLDAAVVADDWFSAGGLDHTEDVTVAWVLAWAAVREPPGGLVRADMLDSLQGMAIDDRVPAAALRLVISEIDRSDVSPAEVDFYDDLVEALSRLGQDSPSSSDERSSGAERCLDLVRGLASRSPAARRTAATALADLAAAGELDAGETGALATVLAWAVERESGRVRPVLLSTAAVLAGRDGRDGRAGC